MFGKLLFNFKSNLLIVRVFSTGKQIFSKDNFLGISSSIAFLLKKV